MAANAGSMFQYWKRFDLQQLQVSLSLRTLPCFLNAVSASSGPGAVLRGSFGAVYLFFWTRSGFFFPGPSGSRH